MYNLDTNCRPLIPQLARAYLKWKYAASPPPIPSQANSAKTSPDECYDFDITVIDLYSKKRTAHIKRGTHHPMAESLVLHGYLGTSPINPSLAISLDSLELFRCIKLFKVSFSTEAFTKLLCYMYFVRAESDDEDQPRGGDAEGDLTDGSLKNITPCASHWKAACANSINKFLGAFEESGIFAACCRHGLILWVVDMVRSDEL